MSAKFFKSLFAFSLFAISASVAPDAIAQAVGSKVQVSPFSMANQWFGATVVEDLGGGSFKVRLDKRPGYPDGEEYVVAKKWMKAAAAGAPAAPAANNAPQPVNGGAQPGGEAPEQTAPQAGFSIGQRVMANSIHTEGSYWHPGTITGEPAPGMFEVHFDHNNLKLAVKKEWIKGGAPAKANTAPANNANNNAVPATNAKANQGGKADVGKGAPPSGEYTCNMLSGGMFIHIGTLEIQGNNYRGFTKSGPFHAYTTSGGNLNLSSGLVSMPEGFTLKSVAYVGGDSKGRPMIKIRYVGPTGYHDTIDAVKQ
ncbi:MAG: hypothetical protein IPG59_22935 [Candidatus Melainabacteria bacterium]|nr:MAG: hypothetical protein IPG59_22935 [Candidatus Melainabacteria bacterium]